MQEIPVKDQNVSGLHLDINELEAFQGGFKMLLLDIGLVVLADMVQAAELVRPLEHLQAAILARRLVQGDIDAHHVRREAAVVVPIAEILMPFPGAAFMRLLHGHLMAIEVDRLADRILSEVDHALVAGEQAVLIVLGLGPHFEKGGLSLFVALRHHRAGALLLLELRARVIAEFGDFVGAEQAPAQDVAVARVAGQFLLGHCERHRPISSSSPVCAPGRSAARNPVDSCIRYGQAMAAPSATKWTEDAFFCIKRAWLLERGSLKACTTFPRRAGRSAHLACCARGKSRRDPTTESNARAIPARISSTVSPAPEPSRRWARSLTCSQANSPGSPMKRRTPIAPTRARPGPFCGCGSMGRTPRRCARSCSAMVRRASRCPKAPIFRPGSIACSSRCAGASLALICASIISSANSY